MLKIGWLRKELYRKGVEVAQGKIFFSLSATSWQPAADGRYHFVELPYRNATVVDVLVIARPNELSMKSEKLPFYKNTSRLSSDCLAQSLFTF